MPRPKRYDAKAWVKLTKEELSQLQVRRIVADLPLSRYLVEAGLSDGRVVSPEDRENRERLLFELRIIGRNLNQLTARVNSGQKVSEEALVQCLQELAQTVQEIRCSYHRSSP